MKTFQQFILENKRYQETGVNTDIIKLSSYILDDMKGKNTKKAMFNVKELAEQFPFVENWNYNKINVWIHPDYINKTVYMKINNSVVMFIKAYSKAILNHELTHVMQSANKLPYEKNILLMDYENRTVLTQIKNFFEKNTHNIDFLEGLLFFADEREMGAYTHAFKKYDRDKKVEILSYVLLLKYFNLKNLIIDSNTLDKFMTIWYRYYGSSIPFFDRIKLSRNVSTNNIEINRTEVDQFIKTINTKLNKAGSDYLMKISNQYNDNELEIEKLIKLLNKAKLNILRNSFKNILDLKKDNRINISPTQSYDMTTGWK